MKVYKDVAHVVSLGLADKLTNKITEQINKYQNEGMQVEIQYSTCSNGSSMRCSALILAYAEE